eukprot:CAMPEP_0119012868 /NCGR_PEP_ID=MMETSP1176-20130426/7670_1 /TAXON_ID=265551 /ORGANISM="Synedropsis recta cf, Strain CCMP1620" /LENGTH=148 /DNA_ID=CAMNT_0006965903 /DNA_START=27 /DNA_END=473 /DNA_ORIENTATION=-
MTNNTTPLLSLLLLLLLLVQSTTAWGPLARQAFRFRSTQLRMASSDDDSSSIDSYRAQLERTYLDEDGFDMRHFEDSDFVRKEVIDSITSHEKSHDFWTAEAMAACGDDCEECLLPDDFKIIPDDSINVMAFLGIQRAEPIQKRADWD